MGKQVIYWIQPCKSQLKKHFTNKNTSYDKILMNSL